MGIYINNRILMEKEKERADETTKANMILQLAEKEMEIQNIKMQNANMMLEIAMLKGGM